MSAEREEQFRSEMSSKNLQAATFLLNASMEMQGWSGSLDWSKRLSRVGVLINPQLKRSFSKVTRRNFLPESEKPDEGYDRPLSIGHDQTNSQPSLVARMLELLNPKRQHAILDVGSGSGWTTGLLASVVGPKGRVIGTERIPELVDFATENLSKYDFPWAKIVHTGSQLGLPDEAPFQRILVSAHMIEDWIPILTDQLSPRGGVMVAPLVSRENHGGSGEYDQSIAVITRHGPEFSVVKAMHEVSFVPLVYNGDPKPA